MDLDALAVFTQLAQRRAVREQDRDSLWLRWPSTPTPAAASTSARAPTLWC
jgi:hypothetical protein